MSSSNSSNKRNPGSRKIVSTQQGAVSNNSSAKSKQGYDGRPEVSKVVSQQKIAMRARGIVQQIEEKENEARRYSIPHNINFREGSKLLNTRAKLQNTKKLKREKEWSNMNNKEPDSNRPASVTLPYLSPRSPLVGLNKKGESQHRSLLETSDEEEEIQQIDLGRSGTGLTSRNGMQFRDFHNFPAEEDKRARVEHNYTNVELDPVSYTYLLMLEENTPSSVVLRNHGLGTKSLSVVRKTLENNNNVKELDLEGNSLNNAGVEDLGIMLRGDMYIEHLNISSNAFSSRGIIAIGHLLESNKTLQSLSLSRNFLTNTDLELLCSSLEDTDNNLKTLDLSFNRFTPEAGHILGRFLRVSRKLEDLNIAGNNFGATGMRPIFSGLRKNDTLRRLDVAYNEIADQGMRVLSELQSLGRELQYLDLSDNFITIRGVKLFMPILDGNDTLNVLKIDDNQIGTNGLIYVLESLLEQMNDTLTQIHARGVFADHTIANLCEKIRSHNTRFVLFGVNGNGSTDSNDAMSILQIYLSKNRLDDSERSDRIGTGVV